MSFLDFVGSLANQGGEVAHGIMQGKTLAQQQQAQRQAAQLDMQRFLMQKAAQDEEARHNQASEEIAANKPREGVIDPVVNRNIYDHVLPQEIRARLPYSDYVDMRKMAESYGRGEIGQENQRQIRIEFPPQGSRSMDDFTAVQVRQMNRQQAEAEIRALVLDRRAQHHPGPATGPDDYQRIARKYSGAMTPEELRVIALDQWRHR